MKCRLISILAAVSMVLCAAVCVLSLRGCNWRESFTRDVDWYGEDEHAHRDWVALYSGAGCLRLSRGRLTHIGNVSTTDSTPSVVYSHRIWQGPYNPLDGLGSGVGGNPSMCNRLGFAAGRVGIAGDARRSVEVVMPYWFAALITAAAPLAWVRGYRRRRLHDRRRAVSLCAACGYDLRFTPVRCPECGAKPQTQ